MLAVLPSVKLHLPDDPPGVVHATSALLEAVLPAPADAGEAAGDSQDQQRSPRPQVAGEAAQVALRLTVFASGAHSYLVVVVVVCGLLRSSPDRARLTCAACQ